MTTIKKWPSFKLLNENSEECTLAGLFAEEESELILFYFYPKAMTPGCTTQACELRDHFKSFAKFKCRIVGVSPDLPARLLKFIEKEKLNFTLLSDPDFILAKKVSAFGPKKFMGKSYEGILRTSFIVNRKGQVLYQTEKVATKTHHDDMLEVLKGL
jgi:thioredoxin-dependent peroxiredoxin